MGKFPFKRPRIISKKFPEIDSSIDSVTRSLNDLVFTYNEKVHLALSKKHWMMGFSSIVLLLVLGSFISQRGKADSSVFYPETCLGGWSNPHNAQGEPETTSNGDESQFNTKNSALLAPNAEAEMYCGNFKGKFDASTKPTKIIVSLALTKGTEIREGTILEKAQLLTSTTSNEVVATGTDLVVPVATTSTRVESGDASSTTSTSLGTSTEFVSSSTVQDVTPPQETAIAIPSASTSVSTSVMDGIIQSVQDTINDIFKSDEEPKSQTDTVVAPSPASPTSETQSDTITEPQPIPSTLESQPATENPPANTETPASTDGPSSFNSLGNLFASTVFTKVFAEDIPTESSVGDVQQVSNQQVEQSSVTPAPPVSSVSTEPIQEVAPVTTQSVDQGTATAEVTSSVVEEKQAEVTSPTTTEDKAEVASVTTNENQVDINATTTQEVSNATGTQDVAVSSSTDMLTASTTESTSSSTIDTTQSTIILTAPQESETTQNNFLEVLYTFDGKIWTSLGLLNEISMKYRTFEIPVTASTSWQDMSQLQIKLQSTKKEQDNPMVYLDGVKVEVLFESTLEYQHPDFNRDTILSDEIYNGMRIVSIVNNDTNREEVWYMYLDDATTTDMLTHEETSTVLVENASTTENSSAHVATTSIISTSSSSLSVSTSTTLSSTTVPYIKPVVPKNVWLKFDGKAEGYTLQSLAKHIQALDEVLLEHKDQEGRVPDFTIDRIKAIKGIFLDAIVVQVEKNNVDELWVYDIVQKTQEKIRTGSSTSVSSTYPLGMKGGSLFWLSKDEGKVFAYNFETKSVAEKIVPHFNAANGERSTVLFEGILWKVIISAEGFLFFTEETGEVFSDDNSLLVEEFRTTMDLDTTLSQDMIDDLNLLQKGTAEISSE